MDEDQGTDVSNDIHHELIEYAQRVFTEHGIQIEHIGFAWSRVVMIGGERNDQVTAVTVESTSYDGHA